MSAHPAIDHASHPDCPVCRSHAADEIKSGPALGARIIVSGCRDCGLVYASPRIPQPFAEFPPALFQNDWEAFNPRIATYQFERLMAAIFATAPKLSMAPHKSTILDVGCGPGYLMAHARAHGWQVIGVDPWASLAAWGRKHLGLDIRAATWEDAKIPAGGVDVVTLLDVLPLVREPVDFLAKCFEALRPGGIVHVSVWNNGTASAAREAFLVGAHQTAFTPTTLMKAFTQAGFRAGQIDCETVGGPNNDQEIVVTARRPVEVKVAWKDIADEVPDADRPFLDRKAIPSNLTGHQAAWRENGYLILRNFIPHDLVDRYVAVRRKIKDPLGWHSPSAYEEIEEMKDIALHGPLARVMEELIGKPLGLHLVLTGWRSTTRDWHQDDYLNPPEVNSHYMALWLALDDISPDAGPFQFVPGSHRWPLVRRSKVMSQLPPGQMIDDSWPWLSEEILSPFFEAEIDKRQAAVVPFLGKKGDVLLWHSNLLHRGSLPRNPHIERRSLIGHFTALGHRNDMHATRQHKGGGHYFDLKADSASRYSEHTKRR
jgi:SAM-dependent methyltransferase